MFEAKIVESEKAGSCRELNPGHLWLVQDCAGGCLVVVAQWQSTSCTSQVSWVQFPVTASLFTFFYFCFKTSKFSLFQYEARVLNRYKIPANINIYSIAHNSFQKQSHPDMHTVSSPVG